MAHPNFAHPLLESRVHYGTVFSFLEAAVTQWPNKTWCKTPTGLCTRTEAWQRGLKVAQALKEAEISRGERILVALPNGLEFVYAWFGGIQSGAVIAAINPRAIETELEAALESIRPAAIICEDGAIPKDDLSVPVISISAALKGQERSDLPGADALPSDAVSLIQSSGSTGKPKYVIETNEMYTLAAEGFPFWLDLDESDVMLTTLPLSHINAQAYSMHGSLGIGAELVLLPHFSASSFWEQVIEFQATQFNAIGAMLEILMERPSNSAEGRNTISKCYSAPTPSLQRHKEIEERLGLRLIMGYALSESPYGLVVPVGEEQRYEVMGKPRQHPALGAINAARVMDSGNRRTPVGEMGELQLQNPAITPGYLGMNLSESGTLTEDGWLRTGDIVTETQDGYFTFQGRQKEIIRHKGENLSPVEVELVIDAHPDVSISAVVGVPSPLSEEDIKAYIHLHPGSVFDAWALHEWCSAKLPPYKRPRYYEVIDEWPLTETNKIAKNRLYRDRTSAEQGVY